MQESRWKSRVITLSTKSHLIKAMVFPVVMYGCERWMEKKAEHRGIDALELWCWRILLRVPWTARRWNQSILKEIHPEYSLEVLMLTPKIPCIGYLMWRTDSLERTQMLGKVEGRKTREWMRGSNLDGITVQEFEQVLGVGDGQGSLACCSPWVTKSQTWVRDEVNWTQHRYWSTERLANLSKIT